VRANARKAALQERPLPQPPARRPVVRRPPAVAAAATAVSAELASQISSVQDKFERLESQAQLEDIFSAVGDIDNKLTKLPFDLEALRDRGYVHSGQLEDRLEALDDKWDEVRPRVEKALSEQVERLDRELDQTERQVNRLSRANAALVKTVDSAVDSLGSRITAARRAVDGLYDGIENELNKIEYSLGQVGKMLDLMAGSQEIRLLEAEGPLLAVKAEWQQDGDEGPKGYLFLTDQRLLFEQREEVVTKKRFGIFKADSEMVQKLHIAVPVHEIEQITHKEEGGFLGMGKDDILELVFAATASLSRARFHLDGQDSEDWAAMLNRIQSGEIDGDRSDEYLDELEAAEITSASFPEQCPACFAAIPEQPRGVTSHVCEFCGATVQPLRPDA
jgi:archaellum component FlaC